MDIHWLESPERIAGGYLTGTHFWDVGKKTVLLMKAVIFFKPSQEKQKQLDELEKRIFARVSRDALRIISMDLNNES